MTKDDEIFLQEKKHVHILFGQYRDCWWTGDIRIKGSNTHDFDLEWQELYGPHMTSVKKSMTEIHFAHAIFAKWHQFSMHKASGDIESTILHAWCDLLNIFFIMCHIVHTSVQWINKRLYICFIPLF